MVVSPAVLKRSVLVVGRDEECHFDAKKSTESVLVFERRQQKGKQKATESKPTRKRKESSAGPQSENKRSK